MQIKRLPVEQIELNTGQIDGLPANPRQWTRDDIDRIANSLRETPELFEMRPCIVYPHEGKYVLLAGNLRFCGARQNEMKDVPCCVVPRDTSIAKMKEIVLKDNGSWGAWDFDELANKWDDLPLTDWGVPAWEEEEEEEELEAVEDDFDIPDEIETDIVLGDLFEIGEHRLLCGDSTDSDSVAKLMNGEKADMVFTDPPYGMKLDTDYSKMPSTKKEGNKIYDKIKGDHDDFTPELINTIFACFNDCKEIFIWGADYFAELLPNKNDGSWVVWDKRVDENFDKMIGSAFELCWSKSKHQRKIARINNTLFSGEQDAKNKLHPTQKPIKLVTFFFNNWGKKNDLVADLYLGSGSTMVASHQLKRKCYGLELDPKYCDVIVKRMIKLDPTLKIKRNGVDVTKEWI